MKTLEQQFNDLMKSNEYVQKKINNALGITNKKDYIKKINLNGTTPIKKADPDQLKEIGNKLYLCILNCAKYAYSYRNKTSGRYTRTHTLEKCLEIKIENNDIRVYYNDKAWHDSIYKKVAEKYPKYSNPNPDNKGFVPLIINDGFIVKKNNFYKDPDYPNEPLYPLKRHKLLGKGEGRHFMEKGINDFVEMQKNQKQSMGIHIKLIKKYNGKNVGDVMKEIII